MMVKVTIISYRRVSGLAVANVYDPAESGIDFSKPLDAVVVAKLNQGSPAWNPWIFDLETGTGHPINGIDGRIQFTSRSLVWVIDERSFLVAPYDGNARSKVYELSANGMAREHADVQGVASTFRRVR